LKFKQFLAEKYINTNKEYFFLLDGRVPLAPKLWSRLNKVQKIPLCYHTTNLEGLAVIKKLQGKKKQISAFRRGDMVVAAGVETDGGILIELKGESTLIIDGDAWTSLDRSGTRWWDLKELSNGKEIELDNLRELLIQSMKDLLKDKFTEFIDFSKINKYSPTLLAKHIEENFPQDQKRKFISEAMQTVEKQIKHIDFEKIIKNADKIAENMYKDMNMPYFDEVVLHNFKILNVYGVVGYRGDNKSRINKLLNAHNSGKIKLDGWTHATYIEDIDNGKVESVKTLEELD
jgi:hypothetical protein